MRSLKVCRRFRAARSNISASRSLKWTWTRCSRASRGREFFSRRKSFRAARAGASAGGRTRRSGCSRISPDAPRVRAVENGPASARGHQPESVVRIHGPLAAIRSAVSGLRDAGPLSPAQETLAEELDEASARLNRLVRNLLDLSRLEAGHLHPHFDWQDVRDLVHGALQNANRALAEHPVTVEIPPDLPPAKLDSALTEQILANLLNNAAVHTPAGTPVEIRARSEGDQLVLEVADHGPGLPTGNPARWFDRF